MQIVYWAHSYREQDAAVNQYFGILIEEAARLIVNFDPPSKEVNSAKLEQNLRGCDGMVAVLTWRDSGPSPYILYEITLSLRARKPVLVFLDDRLPDSIVPARVLQRRFSHRTYFRQVRDHTYALRELKAYIGEQPGPRYQPSFGQRTCGLLGFPRKGAAVTDAVRNVVRGRGYRLDDLEKVEIRNPLDFDAGEKLACLDVVLRFADASSSRAHYWAGATTAAAIPSIALTSRQEYQFDSRFPHDFQPRVVISTELSDAVRVIEREFDLYEQVFLKAEDAVQIERYTRMQIEAGALGGHYESNTRQQFVEVIMGDKFDVRGQVGAVGRQAHAHDITFNQVWREIEQKTDLAKLAEELGKLQKQLDASASEPAHKLAVGAVAAAEQSAKEKDGSKALQYLKSSGTWALGVAEKLGLEVAKSAIKASLGMP